MTRIPGSFFVGGGGYGYGGGLYGYGATAEQAGIKPAAPDDKAKPAGPLERPYALSAAAAMPGFGRAPPLYTPFGIDWGLAWAMSRYSACVLAFALTAGPVLGGTRTWEIRRRLAAPRMTADGPTSAGDPVPPAEEKPGLAGNGTTAAPEDKVKAFLADAFEPLWPGILCGLQSLNFGFWLQEVIWGDVGGWTLPVELRSFLPWEAGLLRDDYGRFAGFQYQQQKRDARYAFLAVNDPHVDPVHGYAWADRARDDWWRAVNSNDCADRTEKKASGIQMLIGLPIGETWVDDKGNPVMPKEVAQTIFNAAVSGQSSTHPLSVFPKRDVVSNPKLADIPAIKIDRFDWGNLGPAILAQIGRLDALDKRILRAWRQPERAAMEGTHGTLAEAGAHQDIGVLASEAVQATLYGQAAAQLVDRALVTNLGPEWRGRVGPVPGQLADPDKQNKQATFLAAVTDPNSDASKIVDWQAVAEELDLPVLPPGEIAARKAEAAKQQADAAKAKAAAGFGPPSGANGNGNGGPAGGRMAGAGA